MTAAEFINNESTLFQEGQLIVVSGPSLVDLYDLLLQTRDALILAGKGCMDPFDTRATKQYPSDLTERSFQYEYEALANAGSRVVLIANQFDRNNTFQNPEPVSLEIDVLIDLLRVRNIDNIPEAFDERFGDVRGLTNFMSRVYHYGDGEATLIKVQVPFRP